VGDHGLFAEVRERLLPTLLSLVGQPPHVPGTHNRLNQRSAAPAETLERVEVPVALQRPLTIDPRTDRVDSLREHWL
jgi:hypothetical protein